MKRIIFLMLFCFAAMMASDGVIARPGHGGLAPSGPCAGDAYHATDGCDGAPLTGSIQYANFFTVRAPVSGQSYMTRPPWFVAGVDYAIGIPAASAAALKDPTSASLPSGCNYNSGTHHVTCGGVADITFDGWDFGNTAAGCVRLLFNANATGTITVKNSNFLNGANCDVNQGDLIDIASGSAAALVLINSVVDGAGDSFPYNLPELVNSNSTGCTTIKYVAFFRAPARDYEGNSTCAPLVQFSYAEGWAYASKAATSAITAAGSKVLTFSATPSYVANGMQVIDTTTPSVIPSSPQATVSSHTATTVTINNAIAGAGVGSGDQISFSSLTHAEFALTDTRGGTAPIIQYSYNVFLQPASAIGLETTTEIYLSNGTANPIWTTATVDHNVLVSNIIYTNRNLVAYMANPNAQITTLNWTSNYFDPTGAFGCFTYGGTQGTINYSGNVDLLDSSTVDGTHCFGHH